MSEQIDMVIQQGADFEVLPAQGGDSRSRVNDPRAGARLRHPSSFTTAAIASSTRLRSRARARARSRS